MNLNNHNSKMKLNMERLQECITESAKIVGAKLRKDPDAAREQDSYRVKWRLDKGHPAIKGHKPPSDGAWVDVHTRKTTGVPLSKWTDDEKKVVKKFLEAIDDVGTFAW